MTSCYTRNFKLKNCWSLGFSVVLLLTCACQQKPATPPSRPPVSVTTTQAVTKPVPVYIDEIGTCIALQSVSILPQVSGTISKIHFQDGVELKKGDPLFTIDPRLYEAARDKAAATLKADESTLALNKSQLKRNESLEKDNYISAQELESLKTTVATNEANVMADRAALQTAQINLEYCSINAPIDGKTGVHQADVGSVVTAYSNQPLLTIQCLSPIYVDFIVTEADLPRVREYFKSGTLKVEVSFPEDETGKREGDLFFLDNAVQTGTGTVKLRAIVQNQDHLFWPGQFVRVRLILTQIQSAVLVPQAAVQIGNNGPYVFVVKPDNTVELRLVTPGQKQQDDIVLEKGVSAGETVVLTGQLLLSPGAAISTGPAAGAEKDGATPH